MKVSGRDPTPPLNLMFVVPNNPLLVPDFIINELREKDDNRITGQELVKREYLRQLFEGPEDDGTKYECKPSKDGMVCGLYTLAETANGEKVFDQLASVDEQWDEKVGCSYVDKVTRPGHCEEMAKKYREGLANTDEQQNTQFDVVTGYAFNNDDAAGFDWFQTHHDDGIMDGYLDTVETANGDMIITEFPEYLPGQTITFDESGMDGIVAAGPFDAVALNEPQNNNVF